MLAFEKNYDLVVAGAGVAGVAAALEAARRGKRVALVEKTVWGGGLATTGLINIYLPLCDGCGHQVTAGIAEELLWKSILYGPGGVKGDWRSGEGPRFRTDFAPGSFILAIDELLVEAGVDCWYDTLFAAPVMEGKALRGIEVENKSGRGALLASVTIDATGDADVAYRAGVPCVEGENNLSVWTSETSLEKVRKSAEAGSVEPLIKASRYGGWLDPQKMDACAPPMRGIDGKLVSDYTIKGRKLILDAFKKRAAENPNEREQWFPDCLPAMAQLRRTRSIEGMAELTPDDLGKHCDDSVGLMPDWRKAGPIYEFPYGALVPCEVENLLVAGRCCAARDDAWEITRVIPTAAMTGQIAGAAAVIAMEQQKSPGAVELKTLQDYLAGKCGFPLHISEFDIDPKQFED